MRLFCEFFKKNDNCTRRKRKSAPGPPPPTPKKKKVAAAAVALGSAECSSASGSTPAVVESQIRDEEGDSFDEIDETFEEEDLPNFENAQIISEFRNVYVKPFMSFDVDGKHFITTCYCATRLILSNGYLCCALQKCHQRFGGNSHRYSYALRVLKLLQNFKLIDLDSVKQAKINSDDDKDARFALREYFTFYKELPALVATCKTSGCQLVVTYGASSYNPPWYARYDCKCKSIKQLTLHRYFKNLDDFIQLNSEFLEKLDRIIKTSRLSK